MRLLPMALAGFFLALWVDHLIPAREFKHLLGGCLGLVPAVMLLPERGFRIFTTIVTIISVLVMLLV